MPVVHGLRANLPVTQGESVLGAIIGDSVGVELYDMKLLVSCGIM